MVGFIIKSDLRLNHFVAEEWWHTWIVIHAWFSHYSPFMAPQAPYDKLNSPRQVIPNNLLYITHPMQFGNIGWNKCLTSTLGRHGVFNMIYFSLYHNIKNILPDTEVSMTFTVIRHGVFNMIYFSLYHNIKNILPDTEVSMTFTVIRHGVFNMIYFSLYHNIKNILPDTEVSKTFTVISKRNEMSAKKNLRICIIFY